MKHSLKPSQSFVITFMIIMSVFCTSVCCSEAAGGTLSLGAGWNFLSFPKLPGDTTIEHMLPGDVTENVVIIWGYDNAAKQWKRWKPAGGALNTLTSFEIGKGYWLYLNSNSVIDISAWSVPLPPVVVHLYEGWNLAGYHGTSGAPVIGSLSDLDGKWSIIWNWDSGQWSVRHSSIESLPFPSLDAFSQSKAYWVRMKPGNDGDWKQMIYGSDGSTALCPSDARTLPQGIGDNLDVNNVTYCVKEGSYNYSFVNIHSGGKLIFEDAPIDFWTRSILVEASGNLIVGTADHPIGTNNPANVVTFHLYGDENQTTGISCKTTTGNTTTDKTCGVSSDVWSPPDWVKETPLPGGVTDKFYRYKKLPTTDVSPHDQEGNFFGFKTLALSYGGTLRMFGKKGTTRGDDSSLTTSGTSWARLAGTVQPGGSSLTLDRPVDWRSGDKIAVTTTDYLPSHSEELTIKTISQDGMTITLDDASPFRHIHNGDKYDLKQHNIPTTLEITADSVETRAAVALLSRNIRIVSAGSNYGEPFPGSGWFGGHTIVRQGFEQYQVQGVEFYQLGQGGKMAHSPVNFHLTRTVPGNTFVKDCSVWDSMTRWYELRNAYNVTLKRNVGFKSIGHGYFLADGAEVDNNLTANIGIYARPALDYKDNPRKVPGVYSSANIPTTEFMKYGGDAIHPSIFYISNGYNTFENNMAAGAGACGACYWIVPGRVGALSRACSGDGYSSIQQGADAQGGEAPIKTFKGNYCSTAQHSLITIGAPGTCGGVQTPLENFPNTLQRVTNDKYDSYYWDNSLYPDLDKEGVFKPRKSTDEKCSKGQTQGCAIGAIENYTSSFHWASTNVSAIWLRTNWYLFSGGALTDILNGGLTMVSGGSYDQVTNGYWALTRKSVFIGHTQDNNPYATNAGPVNANTTLKCSSKTDVNSAGFCLLKDEGISFPTENFSVYQRLYNIYDGPVYQEKNAYLRIKETLVDCGGATDGSCSTRLMYGSEGRSPGIPKAKEATADGKIKKGDCILPNAAIGWKQPNGFYYPPAFHSSNLYFDDVDLRHFIIIPLFEPGTNDVSANKVTAEYCTYPPGDPKSLFSSSFTDVDRQTELNDDDGTLSGLKGTISVNNDQFFWVPMKPYECLAEQTCFQVPYDYVTAAIYPDCATTKTCSANNWAQKCQDTTCGGVPIYRQLLLPDENRGVEQSVRMAGAGISQRSTMIYNNGIYYIDTASTPSRLGGGSVFEAGKGYNFFLLYAKPTTKVTLEVYVGQGFDVSSNLSMVRGGNKMPNGDGSTVLVAGDGIHGDISGITFTRATWPQGWTKAYNDVSGMLTVTMDMTGSEFTAAFNAAKQESCKPSSFCAWKDNTCKCANDPDNPSKFPCEASICEWSVKAYECPGGGCYGFKITFPGTFTPDDDGKGLESKHRPAPGKFLDASRKSDWCFDWQKTPQTGAGQSSCSYDAANPPVCPAQ